MPEISSTVGQAILLTASFAIPGLKNARTAAIVSATNPTSTSNASATTISATIPISVRTLSRSSCGIPSASAVAVEPPAIGARSSDSARSFWRRSKRRVRSASSSPAAASAGSPAEQEEHDDRQQQVEHERAEEQQRRVLGQVVVLDDAVDDRAEHADRREAAGRGAVDHAQPHQHGIDAVLDREAERDRRDDRDGARDDRAGGGQHRGDEEHHPRDRRRPAADRLDGAVDQPVDRAVAGRDREQVRDPDEDHEQIAREPGEDVVLRDAHRRADDERGDDAEDTHVDPGGGRDQEDRDEHEDRNQLVGHCPCSPFVCSDGQRRAHQLHGVAGLPTRPMADLLAA
jgi:hypothetical protein